MINLDQTEEVVNVVDGVVSSQDESAGSIEVDNVEYGYQ
jgi:hypothetical protein